MVFRVKLIERKISQRLLEASQHFPALVLTGARQTGKTTLLRHLFPEHRYVSLDRPATAEQAELDPEAFFAAHPAPLIIDEIQYAPALFRFLKIKIDEKRELKGQFLMTGSQKFTLMKGVSESLAGRVALIELEGLSCLELKEQHLVKSDADGYTELLYRGTFPELWTDTERPVELFFDSYIATYLERDVTQILAVGNLRDFERFLRACALRSSQQLNKSDLARDVGISATTAGEWLSVLEALGQIVLLEPWFGNLNKRLVKSPKLYMAEPALICALAGMKKENLAQSPMIGAIWETFVFAELRKQLSFAGVRPKLWYYRDQGNYELDFILEQGSDLTFYECKWTSSPQASMAKSMNAVADIFLSKATTPYKIVDRILVSRAEQSYQAPPIRYDSPFSGLVRIGD